MERETNNIKLYEIILLYKTETEKDRDEINKYYTSLFAALLSVAPFLDNMTASTLFGNKDTIRYALLIISVVGFILSVSWQLTLRRIWADLQGIDRFLVKLERDINVTFIADMIENLIKNDAPARVTKQQMLVPYTFKIIFICIFIYSITYFILEKF